MRVTPVLMAKSAGLWLLDWVCSEWMNAILSTCFARFGKISETQEPLWPCWVKANGDFISGPTSLAKKPVNLSMPSSF